MILETEVQCLHPNGHATSGETLVLTFDTESNTSTLAIERHGRFIHVSLPMLMRELERIQAADRVVRNPLLARGV